MYFDKKLWISLCEIFFSHLFRAFWNLWNILQKCLDIELLVQISKSDGLPRSSNKRKTVRSPSDSGFEQKNLYLISLCEIFSPVFFRSFWNLWNILWKCLDIEFLYRYPSLTVLHGLLTKGRQLEARHETKDFNGKPGRQWIWAKKTFNFTLRDIFHKSFSRFL